MNKEKIALLVDSCGDVPKEFLDKYHMYVIPLKVIRDGVEFIDGVDITSNQVNDELPFHDFKTSLPGGSDIEKVLDEIKSDGYQKVVMITISSGLSGTYNFASLVAQDYQGLQIEIIDSLSIGIGIGLQAIHAGTLIEQGLAFKQIVETIRDKVKDSHVFFCLATLEYLKKGGRIGRVQAMLGSILDLKPIITCDQNGVYTTVARVRSHKQSLKKTVELIVKEANQFKHVNIGLAYSVFNEDVEYVKTLLLENVSNINLFFEGQVSPVLVVHTGPGLVGISIYGMNQ